jgi:hypothetical protein
MAWRISSRPSGILIGSFIFMSKKSLTSKGVGFEDIAID